jgi:thioredoxin reductase (NADPH)
MKMHFKIIFVSCLVIVLGLICIVQCHEWFGKRHFDIANSLIKENTFPLVIIGSGPAGLSAAFYGARQKLKTLVIEGSKPGGLLTETSYVENMPGFKAILGKELMAQLKDRAVDVGAEFIDDVVESIDFSQWPYVITTEDGKNIHAFAIIISTGATPKKLGIPGEDEYWGKGVATCAICDAPFYKGKEVVVIGGGDSSIEESMQLAPYAKKVTILVRKSSMRAAPSMQDLLKGFSNIEVQYNLEPKRVLGNDEQVTAIELLNNKTNETYQMAIDGVFLAIGHIPNTALVGKSLRVDANGYIMLRERSQETSMPGVFAAGDVEDHRYRQAGVAAGSGIKAALDAAGFLSEIGFNEKIAARLQETQIVPEAITPGIVKEVKSAQEFQKLFNATQCPVFVDFYAEYCPSCMQMLPQFEAVAQLYKGCALFISVDFEKFPEIAENFEVKKVPTLLVFNEGKLVARFHNAMKKVEIQELAAQIVKQTPAE